MYVYEKESIQYHIIELSKYHTIFWYNILQIEA